LRGIAQRHDVVAVSIEDPLERILPDAGIVRFADPETGQMVDVDTSARAVRLNYERRMTQDRQARRQLFRQLAIDEVVVSTDGGIVEPLLKFFRRRETRARRRTA
jgi:uncharacterized protein (DUF58 family)